ncbi:MAG: GNAT family N-acetyltransferase [Hafnia sp.]
MDDLHSHALTAQDMPFVMAEFEDGAKMGSFSEVLSKTVINKIVEKQLMGVIQKSEAGQDSGHYFYILTRLSDRKRIGYIWLTMVPSINGQPCLEIRAIGITKAFRGKGYASTLLSDWIEINSHHPMQAKCLVTSKLMSEMLKRRGFHVFQTTPSGTVFLFRPPQ